jgi:sugar phosphate isomerase/epimerase
MRLSIRENMVPGATLLDRLRALQALGFDGVELTTSSNLEQAEEILAAVRETGIQPSITSARGGGCLVDPRPEEREKAVRGHLEALELAARVGALGVISPPVIAMKMQPDRPRIPDLSPAVSRDAVERELVHRLYRRIAARGEELGTAIIVEPLNRYEQWWPCTLRQGVEICREVNSPACKMMADLFHMNIEEKDLPAAIREAGAGYIWNVHLADSVRRLPGTGHTDFRACFRALKEIGYGHYCGLECGIDGEPLAALREAAEYLRREWAAA